MTETGLVHYVKIIEALIFASPEPVTDKRIKQYLPDEAIFKDVIAAVAEKYGEDSGIELCRIDDRWAMRTKTDVAAYLNIETEVQKPLSRAALETLAIIAYHQPVTRADIEGIRGVSISKGTIDILFERGWVKPGRRRQTPGRPLTWITSAEFLDHFGLEDLGDLPGFDELEKSGLLRPAPTLSDFIMTEQGGEPDDRSEESDDA